MYIKPGPNFRLSNAAKNLLGGKMGRKERAGWKAMMIQAELNAAVQPRREKTEQRRTGLLTGYVATDGSTTEQ